MIDGRRTWRIVLMAAVLWGLGLVLLGTRWEGIEIAPGTWQDGVPLSRWAAFWLALGASGLAASRVVRGHVDRAVALVPLLGWFLLELGGTLAPLAWLIYAPPTTAAWLGGGLIGDRLTRGRHAP